MAEQKQSASGNLPKNIRQIGTSIGNTRVYLEDYVYTYLHTQEEQEAWSHRGFILLGKMERTKDQTRYFISGLIRIEDEFFKDCMMVFGDETWAYIYKEMKNYYDNLEIVGWGQDVSHASASLTAEIERSHKQNFNIQKNVLFLLDKIEKEEAFYIFEKNMLQRREGYYVYYEKNPQMQEYMIEANKSQELNISPEEIQEPLVHSYREALLEKKAQLSARKWNGVLYSTSLLLVLSVCVLGVSTVNNVEKMQNLETTINQISSHVGQAGSQSSDVPAMSQNAQGDTSDVVNINAQRQDMDSSEGSSKESDSSENGNQEEKTDDSKSNGEEDEGSVVKTNQKGKNKKANENKDKSQDEKQISTEDEQTSQDAEQTSSNSVETTALTEAQTYLLQGYYVVKKGDSLVGISKKIYGTASKARRICDLNGIEDMDKIYVGQKLELP